MFLCLIKFSVAHLFFILIFKSISFSDTVMSLLQWLHSGSQQKWKWAPNTSPAWNNFNCLSWRNCYLGYFFFFFPWRCSGHSWTWCSLFEYLCFDALFMEGKRKLCRPQKVILSQLHAHISPCPTLFSRLQGACGSSRWRPSPWNSPFSRAFFPAPARVCTTRSAHARERAYLTNTFNDSKRNYMELWKSLQAMDEP